MGFWYIVAGGDRLSLRELYAKANQEGRLARTGRA
jgi:hypothetical protein